MDQVGTIEALYRYPIKSMAGERIADAHLGWYGVAGDRRFALRRIGDDGGFPWYTAGRFPSLLRFVPFGADPAAIEPLPTHVRTPDGAEHPLFDPALAGAVEAATGVRVEMMRLNQGIFDEAPLSVITLQTIEAIAAESKSPVDVRRFRPNVLVRGLDAAFAEDSWVSRTLVFGTGDDAPRIAVTNYDKRCSMINLDPDSAESNPALLKATAKLNDVNAGVYCSITRCGRVRPGDPVFLD